MAVGDAAEARGSIRGRQPCATAVPVAMLWRSQVPIVVGNDNERRLCLADPLTWFWATSAATGEGGALRVVRCMAAHPDYWPETVRALMVHSARWTPRHAWCASRGRRMRKAAHISDLARQFGFGVPNLERAFAIGKQPAISPSSRRRPSSRSFCQTKTGKPEASSSRLVIRSSMRCTSIINPVACGARCRGLGEKLVELKVTLSYFVEPSPGQLKPITPARYRSHGLRSICSGAPRTCGRSSLGSTSCRRLRTRGRRRGLKATRTNDVGRSDVRDRSRRADKGWMFEAPTAVPKRQPGIASLRCLAGHRRRDLAARRAYRAVYPVSGWWKYRVPQKRYDSKTR